MDDKQKREFWQVKWQSDSRRRSILFAAVSGAAVSVAALSGQPWAIMGAILAIAVAAASVGSDASVDPNYKPREPTLELIGEKYKAKATGATGINALALIAAFKEQESAKAQRLLILIGVGFGVLAIAVGLLSENILSAATSSVLAVLFAAWANNVRNIRLKGFGMEVSTSDGSKKSR